MCCAGARQLVLADGVADQPDEAAERRGVRVACGVGQADLVAARFRERHASSTTLLSGTRSSSVQPKAVDTLPEERTRPAAGSG